VGVSATPTRRPSLSARPHLAQQQPRAKRARIDVASDVLRAVAVVPAARPAVVAPTTPPPPLPPPLPVARTTTVAAHALGPLPDPALQQAVRACASLRDCAALLQGPHAPRLDAMLVCALATRAAHLAAGAAEDDEDADAPAFVASLATAALERAPSSRPQQFAQVTVSLARLVGAAADEAGRRRRGSSKSADGDAEPLLPSLRPWLERYLAAAEVQLPRFSERRLCQLAWGAAKLWSTAQGAEEEEPQAPPPPLPAGERWWGALLAEAQDRLPTLRDGRDWSNLLWALARLGVAAPPGWADDALAALTRGDGGGNGNINSSTSAPVLATMRPRERATVLWALASMGVSPPPGWVERELAPSLLCRLSPAEGRAERARRRERRERPWASRGRMGVLAEEDPDEEEEEPESARDVAVTLWALARWQEQQQPPPALAADLAARAAGALDRELPSSPSSSSAAASHSLVVALASLAHLPGALRQGDDDEQHQSWLSLARRALPSLSGRGLGRLVRAVSTLRLRRPPSPEWMRALQMRALQLAASARIRAGELAAVLRFFAGARWFPGAAWWAALLSATESTGLMRAAPLREVLALAGAVRAALGVGGLAVVKWRRRRRRAGWGDDDEDDEGLLASVLLLSGGKKGRHRPVVLRWAQALWDRVSGAEEDTSEVASALVAAAQTLAPRSMAVALAAAA
jgi:hypothetical protein